MFAARPIWRRVTMLNNAWPIRFVAVTSLHRRRQAAGGLRRVRYSVRIPVLPDLDRWIPFPPSHFAATCASSGS